MEIDIVRYHLKEMLGVRGDDVSYIEEHGDAVEQSRYYSEIIVLDTDRTTVFFALSKDLIKQWKQEETSEDAMLEKYGRKNFILVMMEGHPSPTMLTQLAARDKALQQHGCMLQIFYTRELMYNPMKHILVPKHEKLTEEETKQVMEQYMIKNRTQWPIISRNDVIARWLGLRHGEVVRITRYNDTSGQYHYYRCCV